MVNLRQKLEADFPGLFDRESEMAQRKRDTWDRFTFPEPSLDPQHRNIVEFMVYSPFEEAKGSLADKDGKILPLYRLRVIYLTGNNYYKQTIMSGESVVRSLIADIANNSDKIALDDELSNMSGLVYNVETIIMKGEKNLVWNEQRKMHEQKRFHKYTLDLTKSLPEENRKQSGVDDYLKYMDDKIVQQTEQERKDRIAKAAGIDTSAKIIAEAMYGDIQNPTPPPTNPPTPTVPT